MVAKQSLGERVMEIIYHYRLNKNSFSKKIGLINNSIIVRLVNDPERGLSLELLQRIITEFPDISPRWLLMGEGDMFEVKKVPEKNIHYIKYYKTIDSQPDLFRISGYDDCDFATDVYGDGMSPKYRQGDIVICRKFAPADPVLFGEAYLLYVNTNPLLRYIKSIPQPGQFKIGAENSRYEDAVIETKDIDSAYLVKGIIRRELL
jgi:repressor LexA